MPTIIWLEKMERKKERKKSKNWETQVQQIIFFDQKQTKGVSYWLWKTNYKRVSFDFSGHIYSYENQCIKHIMDRIYVWMYEIFENCVIFYNIIIACVEVARCENPL